MVDQTGFFHVSMLTKYVSSKFQQLPAVKNFANFKIPMKTLHHSTANCEIAGPLQWKSHQCFFSSSVAGQLFEKFGIISNVNGYITIVDNLPLPTPTGEITPGFLIFRISQGFFKAPRRPRSAAGFLMEAPAERLEVRYQSCAKMRWVYDGTLRLFNASRTGESPFSIIFQLFFFIGKSSLFLIVLMVFVSNSSFLSSVHGLFSIAMLNNQKAMVI